MGEPLPPDPYLALGVAKDATAAVIKTQYRKLALKYHPDKVQDESQKQNASDQFHKIQTAYEIVGDEARRHRYDAHCRLHALKREVMERGGGGGSPRAGSDVRTAAFKAPTQSPRAGDFYPRGSERRGVSPAYEERKPSYANEPGYFDLPPRAGARREFEYERERSSKRTSPRDDRERVRVFTKESKENERSGRKEKSRRTDRDIRRDRDRKQHVYSSVEEDTASDSDSRDRMRRRMREEDEVRRARDAYYDQARKQQEEAANGYYADDRARKLFTQADTAREYIARASRPRPESERRPSPTRVNSSSERVEYLKRKDGGPPVMIRRGSGRPRTAGRESEPRRSNSREKSKRSSPEIVEESRDYWKPPTLSQSKSSPSDIRPAFDRQRSMSAQVEVEHDGIPQMRRAETMPTESKGPGRDSRRKESAAPNKSSGLRAEAQNVYPTPEHSPDAAARRYHYGQEYADDVEYPTPDGYRTEIREPAPSFRTPRYTRSPSPTKERGRERTASAKHPSTAPQPPPTTRTTSTTYAYSEPSRGAESYVRPAPSRENSGRGPMLYREISPGSAAAAAAAASRSPKPQQYNKYPPPAEGVQYQREIRPQDIKFQTGYSSRRRASNVKPSYGRGGSGSAIYV